MSVRSPAKEARIQVCEALRKTNASTRDRDAVEAIIEKAISCGHQYVKSGTFNKPAPVEPSEYLEENTPQKPKKKKSR